MVVLSQVFRGSGGAMLLVLPVGVRPPQPASRSFMPAQTNYLINSHGRFQTLRFICTGPATLKRGESATWTFRVTNNGRKPVRYGPYSCAVTFAVIRRNGQFVANDDGEANCGAGKYYGVFAPGETKTFTLTWNGRDYTRDNRGELVPPGVYTVQAQMRVGGVGNAKVNWSLENGTVPLVGTVPVKFTVL